MSGISTHVLDTGRGRPGRGIPVILDRAVDGSFVRAAVGVTDADGRVAVLLDGADLTVGLYRLSFDTGAYAAATEQAIWYPEVSVVFPVDDPTDHYHVPLLLSAHGYTTYRGS